jgi:hypothetical protein
MLYVIGIFQVNVKGMLLPLAAPCGRHLPSKRNLAAWGKRLPLAAQVNVNVKPLSLAAPRGRHLPGK